MHQPMSPTSPDEDLLESPPAAPAAPAAPLAAAKTPEQIAKEKRIEELKNESSLVYCGGSSDGDIFNYAPHFAISMVAIMMLFIVSDQRKHACPVGRRGWLRGRF